MLILPRYVIVTPARNEAQFIELTIKSMVCQTIPPVKWIIVSDGSTDGTDEIVERYASEHPWIELIRMPVRCERNFAGKVHAFNAGYAKAAMLEFELIGSMDADVSFDQDYFENLIAKFANNSLLGVGGTPYQEFTQQRKLNIAYDYRVANPEDVPGICQLFRRRCFEEIGGYLPITEGNIDSIAVLSARKLGWQTKTFADSICIHHRISGTAIGGVLTARFKSGIKGYALGYHPLWQLFRITYQITRRPYVTGALAIMSGYVWSLIQHKKRPVSSELVVFLRQEQMQRLRQILVSKCTLVKKNSKSMEEGSAKKVNG